MEFDRRGRPVTTAFCKTEHRRYDLCVRLALVIFKHHLGDAISVGSDESDEGWAEARQFCEGLLGYGADFRLRIR